VIARLWPDTLYLAGEVSSIEEERDCHDEENGDFIHHEGVVIKSAVFTSVSQLIGPDSKYGDAFRGGTLTHTINSNQTDCCIGECSGLRRQKRGEDP